MEELKMFKRTIFALAVAAVAYGGALQAQENATLTLRRASASARNWWTSAEPASRSASVARIERFRRMTWR